jgi:AbrB family looped-hinge helix DNA binding protein
MADSKTTTIVSSPGQIILPAVLRRRLGMPEGGVVTLEEREGSLVLRPAADFEVTICGDRDIVRWDAEDALDHAEARLIRKKLTRKK